MANRYWVGGTGTWNTSSTTNWSATSGGASGASVPTAADSVFFDQAGTYTVTLTGSLTCLDFTVSAGTVTFASNVTLAISGSMSLIAGTIWTAIGNLLFNATTTGKTVTTNGTTITLAVSFNDGNVGGAWTLGSALTSSSAINVSGGTFNTGNFAVSCTQFNINANFTRSIQLGASTLTCSFSSAAAFNANATGLTFNAGTSQINLTASTAGITSAGLTFYNVAFTNTGAFSVFTITGLNTFNNLSFAAPAVIGNSYALISANQTINGALTTTGTAGNRRLWISSETYGIGRTLTVNSAASLTDADFRDIYVKGTAAPISGTRIGNRGNNSGITFDAAKTVYWNLAGAQNWSANAWATTSTGTPSTNNFPLAQDTATFTNAGSVTGTITLDSALQYIGSIDMSGRTTAMTLSISSGATVYGNWTNGSGTAFSGTTALTFSGGTTQTITSAGKTFSCPITVDTYGGTVQLADALSIGSSQSVTITNGTFTTAGFAVAINQLISNNSNVRAINLGASTLNLSQGVTFTTSTNLTFNAGTSQINVADAGAGSINGGTGQTFYNVSFTNTSPSNSALISGINTFNNLSYAAPSSTGISFLRFAANQTINGTLTVAGATAVQRIFLRSETIGTQRTLTVNSLSANDCDFRDIVLAGAAAGASPTRAGNCLNNSGITFPSPKTVYWNLAGPQNWSATAWCTASGGTPAANNFPLAQDTVVFDNAGSADGSIQINAAWNMSTFDASLRTSAMTLTAPSSPSVYGDWKLGTGITFGFATINKHILSPFLLCF